MDMENKDYSKYPTIFFAGFWIRFIAYIIDVVIAQALARIIVNPIAVMVNLEMDKSFPSVYSFLRLIVILAYFVLMTKLAQGQTLGKMITGLRVVPLKEDKLSWTTVLIREGAMRYISYKFWFIYIIVPFTDKHQSLGDIMADTAVIREKMFVTENFFQQKYQQEESFS